MTTQYAGLDVWSETVDHVTDDDTRDASAYAISAIGLADRTRYLKNRGFYSTPAFGQDPYTNTGTYRIDGSIVLVNTSTITASAARTYRRVANLLAWHNSSHWANGIASGGPYGHYTQIFKDTAPDLLVFDFDIPNNCVLKGFSIYIHPAGSHVDLPENMPRFNVWIVDVVAGTTDILVDGTSVDTSANVSTYQTLHELSVNLSITYNFEAGRHRVFLGFAGEYGTNALVNLVAHLPRVRYERSQIAEELGQPV